VSLVKRCPTCEAENAPTAARCGCGAFLIGVDLTERAAGVGALLEPAVQPAQGAAASPASDGGSAAALRTSALAAAAGDARADAPSEGRRCAFADCGQVNPAETAVCVYCNRPIDSPAPASGPAPRNQPMADQERHGASPAPAASARTALIRLPAKLAARFTVEEPLKAAGSEADLFIVRDAAGGRAVLKLYRHGIEPDTGVLERVSKAMPDQIVRLLEYGREDGVPYELLEYCEHGSLRMLLKGRPVPLDAARTLLTELAGAIAHLHECGIVHRDLKPENVLIRGLLPLDLVLTDFGIASIVQATMHYTSAARTLHYSAPEAGSNWVGKPTDYWALGMMLVEAIGGRHPFEGLSDAVIAHWLVTRPIDLTGVADARWQRLCRGLLTRDPQARWGGQEIERWLDGDDTLPIADERAASGGTGRPLSRARNDPCSQYSSSS
jgi:serine/threonine protein kinase